jgi:hydroxyacyl-ACP dehydratase HTD2-like protein with hotdog domain
MVKNANVLKARSVPVGKWPGVWTAETTLSATPAAAHSAVAANHHRAHFDDTQ